MELPEGLIPLVDADVLTYECCFGVEYGMDYTPSFDKIGESLDKKLIDIQFNCSTQEAPRLFLTGNSNFRFDIATVKPYKNRDVGARPYHFDNIRAYMVGEYGATIVEGMEADDMMCIEQNKDPASTIICTRDKDLRMQKGWHYGWEVGKQASFGPKWIDYLGEWGDWKKVLPTGMRLFYYQLICGDTVDNIPGLPRHGPAAARKALEACETEEQMYNAVYALYKKKYGDTCNEMLLEQGRLLWMCNTLEEDGSPVMWQLKEDNG